MHYNMSHCIDHLINRTYSGSLNDFVRFRVTLPDILTITLFIGLIPSAGPYHDAH